MAETAHEIVLDKFDPFKILGEASADLRPLGLFEHLFSLNDQHRPMHFAVTAEIAGKMSPALWRDALDRVQERHPLLSVAIDGSPGAVPSFRQVSAATIPLRIVEAEPKIRWQEEVGSELAKPFDPTRAPLLRAVLIQGRRDTALILVAHHAVADGVSATYLIRDTLEALIGGSLELLDLAPAQDTLVGANADAAACAGATEPQDDAPAGSPATYRPRDGAHPRVKGLRLATDLTARLKDRARQEGTTVHGALCAALAIAGRQVVADWRDIPVRIVSQINTRGLTQSGEACGVFVGAAASVFDRQPKEFWDLARDAKASLALGQTREGMAEVFAALREVIGAGAEIATAAELGATLFAREALLSNLGAFPFDSQFGPMRLEALWGPAVLQGLEGEQTVGVATVDGSLCLTLTSHTPPDGLLAAMHGVLTEACSA